MSFNLIFIKLRKLLLAVQLPP